MNESPQFPSQSKYLVAFLCVFTVAACSFSNKYTLPTLSKCPSIVRLRSSTLWSTNFDYYFYMEIVGVTMVEFLWSHQGEDLLRAWPSMVEVKFSHGWRTTWLWMWVTPNFLTRLSSIIPTSRNIFKAKFLTRIYWLSSNFENNCRVLNFRPE